MCSHVPDLIEAENLLSLLWKALQQKLFHQELQDLDQLNL